MRLLSHPIYLFLFVLWSLILAVLNCRGWGGVRWVVYVYILVCHNWYCSVRNQKYVNATSLITIFISAYIMVFAILGITRWQLPDPLWDQNIIWVIFIYLYLFYVLDEHLLKFVGLNAWLVFSYSLLLPFYFPSLPQLASIDINAFRNISAGNFSKENENILITGRQPFLNIEHHR